MSGIGGQMEQIRQKLKGFTAFYRQDLRPVWRFGAVLVILFLIFTVLQMSAQVTEEVHTDPLTGVDTFKTLDLETLDGEHFTYENIQAYDLTIVDCWTTWCYQCVNEMPTMARFSDELGTLFPGRKVQYIGVCADIISRTTGYDESVHTLAQEISENANVHYPQLIADVDFINEFIVPYVPGFPSIFYLDSEGNVIQQTGALSENGFMLQVKSLLNQVKN